MKRNLSRRQRTQKSVRIAILKLSVSDRAKVETNKTGHDLHEYVNRALFYLLSLCNCSDAYFSNNGIEKLNVDPSPFFEVNHSLPPFLTTKS